MISGIMAQYIEGIDERNFVPKLEWKVLPDKITSYDARAIKKERNYRLRNDVMYFEPRKTVAVILDEFLSLESQLQLFIDEKPDGVYTFQQISRSSRKGKSLYETFLEEIPKFEEECRPKEPHYKFMREKFWERVANHAHLTFVGV